MQVSCEKCRAEYQIDERRLPPAGLKMRCPKCAHTFLVKRAEAAAAPAAPPAPRPAPSSAPPRIAPLTQEQPIAKRQPATADLDFGDLDLPGPAARPAPAPWGAPAAPVAPQASFGELDLPAPASARKVAATKGPGQTVAFGDLDLPAPASAAKAAQSWQDPKKAGQTAAFGDLDLPAPAVKPSPVPGAIPSKFPSAAAVVESLGAELPAVKPPPGGQKQSLFDLDLPSARPAASPPAAAGGAAGERGGFGELDLPAPKGAPSGKQSVFDELDLPIPASAELPVPRDASSGPARAPAAGGHGGLERPRAATMLGLGADVELPLPRRDADLPMPLPGVTMPSPEAQARAAGKWAQVGPQEVPADLPLPRRDVELPMPVQHLGAGQDLADLPVARADQELPVPKRPGAEGTDYGELDLGDVGVSSSGARADVDLLAPRGMIGGTADADEDGNIDLLAPRGMVGGAGLAAADAPALQVEGAADVVIGRPRGSSIPVPPRERARRRQRSKVGQVAMISVLGVAILIGVGLSFTPLGPFGTTFIAERLPRAGQGELGATYIRATKAYLTSDNFADYRQALAELRNGRGRAPADRDLKAYAAYVYFMRVVRYGPHPKSERRGGQLLVTMDVDGSPSPVVKLAAAAREVARNQLPKAAQRLGALVQLDPQNTDALWLLGWTQLLQGEIAPAEATFTGLLAVEPGSGRAHYGLVRAALARNDLPAARARIASASIAAPNHVGILVAQAGLTWNADRQAVAAAMQAADILARRSSLSAPSEQAEAHSLIGQIALHEDRYGEAKNQFTEALRLDERLIAAHVGLGGVLYKQNDVAAALASFQTAHRMNPDDVDAVIGTAMSLIALDQLVDAKTLLGPLAEQENADPRIHFWLARANEQVNDLDGAERELRAALAARAEYTEASIALSRLLVRKGQREEATRLLADARAHAPDTAVAHTTLGQGFLDRGELEIAEQELRRALTLQQQYMPARFLLGSVLRRRGRMDEARSHLEQVAQHDAGYPGLSLERGLLYEGAGDAAQALTMYRAALRASPGDVDLKLRVGATSVLTGALDEAKRMLEEVMQVRPNSAEAHYALGRVRFARSDYIEATSLLQRAVDLDSSVAVYHLYFGWVSDVNGNLVRANEELEQAITLDPQMAEAYWRRGLLRLRSGAPRDAKEDLDKAISLDPELYAAHAALGDALDRMRDLPGAIRAYQQAIAHSATVGQWHYRLGMLQLDTGAQGEAAASLQQSVTLGEAEPQRPGWLPDAYRNLGDALAHTGQRARAIEALRKFLEIAPPGSIDRPEVLRQLGDLGAD
ncbi:MAG: zinc-ribbon domain-containing protein [Deltaproteobacteria bacterium]|nr:zinc-ribbon domain-containing protein [Deltaproteobacteria bacterium]